MPFRNYKYYKHTYLKLSHRKERFVLILRKNLHTLKTPHTPYSGKVSAFTSLKASITVEASFAVPIFFFAVICMLYLFEVMAIQTSVRSGLSSAGKIVMEESSAISMINPADIEENVVNAIGANRLERSIVVNGSSGIDCSGSYMSLRTGIGTLTAEYELIIPVPMFQMNGIKRKVSMKVKTWSGYEKEYLGTSNDETVYVTETGLVYHRDYHCTYLDLSIQMVSKSSIENLRNSGGGKYYACRICGSNGNGMVYITDSGNKYHGSLSCSGLKRTVYAVPLSEVVGKGACVRCAR